MVSDKFELFSLANEFRVNTDKKITNNRIIVWLDVGHNNILNSFKDYE